MFDLNDKCLKNSEVTSLKAPHDPYNTTPIYWTLEIYKIVGRFLLLSTGLQRAHLNCLTQFFSILKRIFKFFFRSFAISFKCNKKYTVHSLLVY